MPWQINGEEVTASRWQYRAGQLGFGVLVRVPSAAFDEVRELAADTGDFTTITKADGTREVVDLSGTPETVTVTPPERLRPFLIEDEYTVKSYTERQADGGSLKYSASLTLVRLKNRAPDQDADERYGHYRYGHGGADSRLLAQSPSDSDWAFDFRFGELALDEDDVAGGAKRARTTTLRLTPTPVQGEVLLETLGTIAAVSKESVPGGDDFYVDNHPENRNTVRITPPANGSADAYLQAGRYVVTDWTVSHERDSLVWRADLSIALIEATPSVGQLGGSRYGYYNYGHTE
jgi:hypothetical protein